MKRKYALIGLAGVLVAMAIVGGSLAATTAAGERATNLLAAPTLEVNIDGGSSAELAVLSDGSAIMPGDTLDNTSFTIENTAEVALYARVTVTKYWTDDTAAKNNTTMDANLIELTQTGSGWLQANEILLGSSGETEVYYCAVPLQAGQSQDLNLDVLVGTNLTNDYQGAGIALDVTVDAVQYVAGENQLNADGILAAFGVEATLAADGSITAVVQ